MAERNTPGKLEKSSESVVVLKFPDREQGKTIGIPVEGEWSDFFAAIRGLSEDQEKSLRDTAWFACGGLSNEQLRAFVSQAQKMFERVATSGEKMDPQDEMFSKMFLSEVKQISTIRGVKPSPGDRGDWL